MSVAATINKSISLGGISFAQTKTVTGEGMIVHSVEVDPGEEGSLTTRTGNTEGTFTADSSAHGISAGNVVDVFWSGGNRSGMVAGTISGADIPLTGGAGDSLPSQDTDLIVSKGNVLSFCVAGDDVQNILVNSAAIGLFTFIDDGAADAYTFVTGAGGTKEWFDGDGDDNPVGGDMIEKVRCSHGEIAASSMKIGVVYDN